MKFSYQVFNSRQKVEKGTIEAASLKEATKLLIDRGWYIKKIIPHGKFSKNFSNFSFGRISLMDKVLFIRHIAIMLKSGISLNEILEVIVDQATDRNFKKAISAVLKKVRSGQTLSNALASNKKVFDPLIINIIKVGEESGTLEKNLEYLASELEDRLELRRKVEAAAFYPAIILSATGGLALVLSYFVLPKIKRLFETLNFELPLSTKILLWIADIMDKHGLLIVVGIIIGLLFLWFLSSRKFVKPLIHRLLIQFPIVGRILVNYNLAMINRTMGITLKSGLTIDQSVEIVADITKNIVYKRSLQYVLPQIQKGRKLSDVLAGVRQSKRNPLFPLLAIKMISVGERTGRLDESFIYLSDYFDKEVSNTTKNLTTILEPVLLGFVGLIVGFIAISVISPIYQVTSRFGS